MKEKLQTNPLINLPMLLRVVGWLLMVESFFMLVPTLTGYFYGESDWVVFAVCAGFTLLSGAALTYGIRPKRKNMGKRDGFLLTALIWVIFSIFGMLPFIFSSTNMSVTNAFFESMSGFTTTGASVMERIAESSHSIHIWRALMQWIGGMGIILFTLAVLPMLNYSGGMQMFNAEVTGITHDKLRPRISQTAKGLWMVYISLTLILIGLLWLGPMNFFESLCHAFGAISTGGFSTYSENIAAWHSVYIKVILTIFMFFGGTSFAMVYAVVHGNIKALLRNTVFWTFVSIIGVMYVLFAINIVVRGLYTGWESITIDPLFQVVSTITSTGYSSSNYANWGPFVLALAFVMMFFGGCAGSTSGGAKIDRIIVFFKYSRNELDRCIHPYNILSVKINSKVVNPDLVTKVVAFLCLYLLLVVVGGVVLSAMGVPMIDSFFSSFSCISNTGLGTDVTGLGGNYEIIPAAGKWVLSFLMLTGRLEIFTVLLLLTDSFWRR